MALKSYALTTVARFKTYAGITSSSDDTLLEIFINQATESIENYCDRRFKQTTYTNVEIDGTGSEQLFLDQYPVDSGSTFTLQERDSAENDNDWSSIDSEDYFVDYDAGIIFRVARSKWGTGKKRYRVTYTAGYDYDNTTTFLTDTIAGDLEYAIWLLVQAQYNRRQGGSGIEQESIGDYSVTYSKDINENDELKNILDKYARNDLAGYVGPYLY